MNERVFLFQYILVAHSEAFFKYHLLDQKMVRSNFFSKIGKMRSDEYNKFRQPSPKISEIM